MSLPTNGLTNSNGGHREKMGWGDEIIASGLARGAAARGKRIAFGDGQRVIWSKESHEIFKGNPNVLHPHASRVGDIEWIEHYGGHRLYGYYNKGKWHWRKFKCIPGEIFFEPQELKFEEQIGDVIIEPRTKNKPNKQWPVERYQELADALQSRGYTCTQLLSDNSIKPLRNVGIVYTNTFRRAMAALRLAQLYVGAEGGMHHSAAAVGVKAVVLFGGFIGPETTGYDMHHNIAVGPACGSQALCSHCAAIMKSITCEQVFDASIRQLEKVDVAV